VRLLSKIILILSLFLYLPVQAAAEKPLYLSFEQRLVFSYLLLAAGEEPEAQDAALKRLAEQLLRRAQAGANIVEVSTFEEFLQIYRGEWPNSNSLANDLKFLETAKLRPLPVFVAKNSALQEKIGVYILESNQRLVEKYGSFFSSKKLSSLEDARELIEREFGKISQLGRQILKKSGMPGQDGFTTFISFAIGEYFGKLSLQSKKQIISQLFGDNLNAPSVERFEIMVLNSGPQFQKLLQIVAREASLGEDLLEIFKRLESKAMAVPPVVVKKIMRKEKRNYNFISYDPRPLGVGTMAQVHQGKLMTETGERDVVFRFLKPEIENRVAEDHEILQELAPQLDQIPEMRASGFPKITPIVNQLTETVRDELELPATIARQKRGGEVYNRLVDGVKIYVPQVIDAKTDRSALMVQELVKGQPLDKVPSAIKKLAVAKLAEVWLNELLFKSGFFHSDLHQGNFLIDIGSEYSTVNLLDFGMGGELSEKQRQYLILLAVGADANLEKLVSEALLGLAETGDTMIEAYVKMKISSLKKQKKTMTPDRWLAWATNTGLSFPSRVVGVSRGITIMDKLLKDSGVEKNVIEISRDLAKKNKWEVLTTLRESESFRFLDYFLVGRQVFKKTFNYDLSAFEELPALVPMCRSVLIAR
jgi:ubiquinone biosynthesis protein